MLPILIVEDEQNSARAIARVFAPSFVTQIATTLRDARRALTEARFSAAIFDITLPDGSGLGALAALRAQDLITPALVLTVHNDSSFINQVHELRAEYVCKSGSLEPVKDFARRVLLTEHVADTRLREYASVFAQRHGLSLRQTEIVAHALADRGREEIATALGVAESTIKTLIHSLLGKCNAVGLGDIVMEIRVRARDPQCK